MISHLPRWDRLLQQHAKSAKQSGEKDQDKIAAADRVKRLRNLIFSVPVGPGDVRIINEAGTSDLNGDFVVGQLGIDSILAAPEPPTAALALGGLALVGLAWKRRARRA